MHTKHTKGKLHINQKSQICTDNWVFCVDAYIACPNHELGVGNARRLVATWNACEGISTEAMEAGCVQKLVDAAATLMDVSGLLGKSADPKLLRPDQNAAVALSKADRICAAWRDVKAALAPFLQTEKPAGEGGPGG